MGYYCINKENQIKKGTESKKIVVALVLDNLNIYYMSLYEAFALDIALIYRGLIKNSVPGIPPAIKNKKIYVNIIYPIGMTFAATEDEESD